MHIYLLSNLLYNVPYKASNDWNNLDNDIKNTKTLSLFKAKLKTL